MNRPLYLRLQSLWHYIAQGLNGVQIEDRLQSQAVTHNLAEARRLMDHEATTRGERMREREV